MSKTNFLKIIIFLIFIFQVLSEEGEEKTIEKNENIEDMEPSFLKKIDQGFHHLKDDILPFNHTIIAFTDINDDGYTDLITFKMEKEYNYTFYSFTYDKESKKFNKVQKENEVLFYAYNSENITIRNLHVGSFYQDSGICFIASFNKKESLIHYISCNGEKKAEQMNINSNILILNRNSYNNGQILYHNGTHRVICELNKDHHLCGGDHDKDFANFLAEKSEHCLGNKNANKTISKKGGLAFVDLNGNCVPDLVISFEDDKNQRHIEIYRSNRDFEFNFCLIQEIVLEGNDSDYGAFSISRIENKKSDSYIPNFDILIPKLDTNQIIVYKNRYEKGYKWDTLYCNENDNKMGAETPFFLNKSDKYNLSDIEGNQKIKFDTEYVTVIRPGDFLGNQNPGILTQFLEENANGKKRYIALYSKEGENFKLFLKISEINENAPVRAFFFDINESGRLSLIVQTEDGKNHIFFNYRNTYFIKSKLMNHKGLYSDINIGATFRYIVTNQDGDRHMEISSQLPQTSDMNMPLPFSLSGLGETNNYVENFQIMSGNYYKTDNFDDKEHKNFMFYTPIIPNTQMKIFKFINSDGNYEWLIELIVQPMDQIVILVIIMIVVMLALLGVIIYLHVREVKEEQKETTKFKSWFA